MYLCMFVRVYVCARLYMCVYVCMDCYWSISSCQRVGGQICVHVKVIFELMIF